MECKVIYVEDIETEYDVKIYRLECDTNESKTESNKIY